MIFMNINRILMVLLWYSWKGYDLTAIAIKNILKIKIMLDAWYVDYILWGFLPFFLAYFFSEKLNNLLMQYSEFE